MKWYWILWILAFAIGETLGFFIHGGTFSEFIWNIEGYVKGQRLTQWSFGHFAIAIGSLWLFFHFAFRMWT